jgi:hypothetical protein
MSQNLSYTFNNKTFVNLWNKYFGKKDEEGGGNVDGETVDEGDASSHDRGKKGAGKPKDSKKSGLDDDGYMPFKFPWSLTVSYGITMSEDRSAEINIRNMRYPYKFTQNLNFSGNIGISDNWRISFTSGYNFEYKKLTTTTLNISRDLHCFEMSCGIVLAPYTSFNFSFRATSQMLADVLKIDKRSSQSTNVQWYID